MGVGIKFNLKGYYPKHSPANLIYICLHYSDVSHYVTYRYSCANKTMFVTMEHCYVTLKRYAFLGQ